MATWRKHTVRVDLETGEILDLDTFTKNYYVVEKKVTTFQPDKTKSFYIKKYTFLCRKKPLNLSLW